MRKKIFSITIGAILVLGIAFLTSKYFLTDVNIYEKYHKSVVMIYHKYIYKTTLNGETIYFNYENGKFSNIQSELKEAEKMAHSNYGTGFFIDNEGKIATNRHVVHNWSAENNGKAKEFIKEVIEKNKNKWIDKKDSATTQINIWVNKFYSDFWDVDKEKDDQEVKAWTAIQNDASKNIAEWESMENSLPDLKFSVETLYLGYAIDGAFATNLSDFKECRLVDYAKSEEIDLALIQAKDRKLPDGVTEIININDLQSEPLKVGEEVSMLGYNLGPDISSTTIGLKTQNTVGKISQEPNGVRVLYSINALPGSSGSPVFSKSGKLVAINYYGYSSQAFNYGILAKHLTSISNQ